MNNRNPALYENLYEILLRFVSESGYSVRSFARFANIKPTSLQNAIYKKSKMRPDVCLKIVNAMDKVCELVLEDSTIDDITCEKISKTLSGYRVDFIHEYESISGEDFKLFSALKFKDNFDILHNELGAEICIPSSGYKAEFNNKEYDLVCKFRSLNKEGQRAAIEQVELLTQIPKYQKQIKKIPPENGQDDN